MVTLKTLHYICIYKHIFELKSNLNDKHLRLTFLAKPWSIHGQTVIVLFKMFLQFVFRQKIIMKPTALILCDVMDDVTT